MNNFLTNKTSQNWKNYSPGGKRRKINNIPFMGKMSDIKAQGTKRVGVLPVKFSFNYMCANFMQPPEMPFNRRVKYSYLTAEERARLTPEQAAILRKKEEDEKARIGIEDARAALRNTRANYRTGLATVSEGRGWLKLVGMGS